uniref:(northern house mosquito) hypothetical protein n=1 Tax=Culex pipiens TaxID=7175 RepID=A0A8D8CCS6_CULPI
MRRMGLAELEPVRVQRQPLELLLVVVLAVLVRNHVRIFVVDARVAANVPAKRLGTALVLLGVGRRMVLLLRFKLDKDDDADRHQEERNGGTNQRAKQWSQLNQDRFRWGGTQQRRWQRLGFNTVAGGCRALEVKRCDLHDELGITGKLFQQHLGPAERDAEQQLLGVLVENVHVELLRDATVLAGQARHVHRVSGHIGYGATFNWIRNVCHQDVIQAVAALAVRVGGGAGDGPEAGERLDPVHVQLAVHGDRFRWLLLPFELPADHFLQVGPHQQIMIAARGSGRGGLR